MPSPSSDNLINAILSLVRDCGGFATKTKLLKYLYLIDIEHYRRFGQTATGFHWIFYKYGPWTKEYEDLLEQMTSAGKVRVTTGTRNDLDTQFLDTGELLASFDQFDWPFGLRAVVTLIVDTWAARPTGEILDYVYFHTEPMRGAERGELLDFGKIEKDDRIRFYSRTRSFKDEKDLKKARKELRKIIRKRRPQSTEQAKLTPPKYDEEFWTALEIIKAQPE